MSFRCILIFQFDITLLVDLTTVEITRSLVLFSAISVSGNLKTPICGPMKTKCVGDSQRKCKPTVL